MIKMVWERVGNREKMQTVLIEDCPCCGKRIKRIQDVEITHDKNGLAVEIIIKDYEMLK